MNGWEGKKGKIFSRNKHKIEREFGCNMQTPCEEATDFWYGERKQSLEIKEN